MRLESDWGRLGLKFETKCVRDVIDEIAMGPFGSNIKVDCFVPSGVPVLNGSNLTGFILSEETFNYVTPEKAASLKRAVASRGDVLITHRGTLGQIVYIPFNSKHDRYVISQSQFRVRCKDSEMLPEFMVYYFHSREGQYELLSNSSQVGVPALARPSTTFQNLEIPVPSIEEQQGIVNTLTAIDTRIAENKKITHHLEQMAQAIYKSWFVEFKPWGGIIPDDWREGTISDISTDIVCGKTPSTKINEYFGDEVPFITIPDMHGTVYITSTERSLSKLGAESQNSKTVPPNSICVSCIATAGLVTLTSAPSQTNQQINTIVCKDGISPYFAYLTMVGMSDHIKMLGSSGSATNNLNKGQFSKIELIIPSDNDLSKFTTVVEPMFKSIKSNQQENACLEKTRDTLLPRLMSGELSVTDIHAAK
jgi:type I restriction enzyme S subunit